MKYWLKDVWRGFTETFMITPKGFGGFIAMSVISTGIVLLMIALGELILALPSMLQILKEVK